MRWRQGRRSSNVEDRRGMSAGGGLGGLGGLAGRGGLRLSGCGMVVVVLLGLAFGADPGQLLQLVAGAGAPAATPAPRSAPRSVSPEEEELADFVSVVLGDTEDTWSALFARSGQTYRAPKLVLFSDAVRSACGMNSAAVGPFYCPGDHKVYIDLSFFRDLRQRFGAPGDFAQAYVIAHEVGHHIQSLTGVSERVHRQRSRVDRASGNALSVRQELQADCYAGVWAHHADAQRQLLERGDIEEGLTAAAAIGDDRLQKQARGHVSPESWTHGSSAQRVRWFKMGLEHGEVARCDTFQVARL